jgi:hypothetical protein
MAVWERPHRLRRASIRNYGVLRRVSERSSVLPTGCKSRSNATCNPLKESMDKRNRTRRGLAAGAVVLGLVAGSYGVAAAASGNGSSSDGTNDAVGSGSSRSSEPLGSPAERRDPADRRNARQGQGGRSRGGPGRDDRSHRDRCGRPRRLRGPRGQGGRSARDRLRRQAVRRGQGREPPSKRGGARRADGGPCLTRAMRCARPPRRPRRGGRWARRARSACAW